MFQITSLQGKKIIVCVTGSVAAIEVPKLVRQLRREGATVFCVMSKGAKGIITADVLQWASGNPVVTRITGSVEHVKLAGCTDERADALVVAPCTANTLGKAATGIDDTPVTTFVTTAFGSGIPIMMVPAMHVSMYQHPIVLQNIQKLEKLNVRVLEPRMEEDKAKFPGLDVLVPEIQGLFVPKDLKGKKVLVTAGPTAEDIDSIRFITNRSSGKMGAWLAEEAHARGAEVTLIRGLNSIAPKKPVKDIEVRSSAEMLAAIKENIDVDILFHTAAVSDFTVEKQPGKISRKEKLALELQPATKILEKIKGLNKDIFLVGFKAECNVTREQLIERAFKKLQASNSNLIVANDIGKKGIGMGSDLNEIYIIDSSKKSQHFGPSHKRLLANKILDAVK